MMNSNQLTKHNQQRGGMMIGIILGVLVGLGVALGVAIYVMKVPTPFNSKSTSRTPAQDAQEAKKNKDWDPNAALSGKPAAKPEAAASSPTVPPTASTAPVAPAVTPVQPSVQGAPNPQSASVKPAQPSAGATAAPNASPAGTGSEVEYFVQVAAFSSEAEAHAMRGKLALSGFEGKVVEREQSGRTVYRVRVGPYGSQAGGDKAKAGLEAAGFDTVVVRTQK